MTAVLSSKRNILFEKRFNRCALCILDATLSDYAWLVVFNLLLFESTLQEIFPLLSAVDEISTILLAFAALFAIAKAPVIGALRPLCASVIMVGIGLLGNLLFGMQHSLQAILIDIFTCIKYPIAALAGFAVLRKRKSMLNLVLLECKALLLVMAVCAVLNLFSDIGMGSEIRYGIRSFSFVFSHYTFLSVGLVGILLLLCQNPFKNRIWIAIALVLMCSTLRSKAFGFVAIFLFLLISQRGKSSPYLLLTLGIGAAIAISWDQIVFYYTSDGFARNELTRAAFEVAGDYAPFGTGFATFGSNVTGEPEFYSPLYFEYGLSNVYGLTPNDASFVSDTFWPTVLGQFGYAGLLVYGALLVSLFQFQRNGLSKITAASLYIYLFISSTSESAFFNPSAVFLAFCAGLAAAGVSSMTEANQIHSNQLIEESGL